MLQMASVYGLQQTAKHAPVFFLPRADEVRVAVPGYACFWAGCCSEASSPRALSRRRNRIGVARNKIFLRIFS